MEINHAYWTVNLLKESGYYLPNTVYKVTPSASSGFTYCMDFSEKLRKIKFSVICLETGNLANKKPGEKQAIIIVSGIIAPKR